MQRTFALPPTKASCNPPKCHFVCLLISSFRSGSYGDCNFYNSNASETGTPQEQKWLNRDREVALNLEWNSRACRLHINIRWMKNELVRWMKNDLDDNAKHGVSKSFLYEGSLLAWNWWNWKRAHGEI